MPVRVFDVPRTLLFLVIFYLGSILLVLGALLALPVGGRPFRAMVHGWSGYHRICARYILGIRVKIEGSVPSGSVLIALKHESFYEAIDLPTLLPHPVVFAKAQLIRLPLWGRAAASYGVVPVERDQGAKALRAMVTSARAWSVNGRPLAIFPEGTRVPHGTRPPLQAGFAGLYKLMGLPVIAVAVNSGPLYHRFWKRPGTITVRFSDPIPAGLPRDEIEAKVHVAINALNADAPLP